jgi:hypothetical protein
MTAVTGWTRGRRCTRWIVIHRLIIVRLVVVIHRVIVVMRLIVRRWFVCSFFFTAVRTLARIIQFMIRRLLLCERLLQGLLLWERLLQGLLSCGRLLRL